MLDQPCGVAQQLPRGGGELGIAVDQVETPLRLERTQMKRRRAEWIGGAGWKLTRAIVMANGNWAEAAVGHVLSYGSQAHLNLHPASGTDVAGNLQTTRYNDFDNFRNLGDVLGTTPIFGSGEVGKWHCVEARMKLNDANQSNGVFELWVNGRLEAQKSGMNWLGDYDAYGINTLFVENYNNDGAPKAQSRYFDNLVVSTQRIGC